MVNMYITHSIYKHVRLFMTEYRLHKHTPSFMLEETTQTYPLTNKIWYMFFCEVSSRVLYSVVYRNCEEPAVLNSVHNNCHISKGHSIAVNDTQDTHTTLNHTNDQWLLTVNKQGFFAWQRVSPNSGAFQVCHQFHRKNHWHLCVHCVQQAERCTAIHTEYMQRDHH